MKACYRKATYCDNFLKPDYSSQNMLQLKKFTLLLITLSNISDTADDNVIRLAGYSLSVIHRSLTLKNIPLKRLPM